MSGTGAAGAAGAALGSAPGSAVGSAVGSALRSAPRSALVASGVVVELGGRRVLDGVSLRVEQGSLVAVLGPNGAGKSTLLAALAGDLGHRAGLVSGTVRLGDVDVVASSPAVLSRLRAVVPQDHTLAFPFPVVDVVRMGRAPWIRTAAADEDDDAVRSAMVTAGVAHLADRAVPTLSGGERARVALARALAQRTGTLLLDEPTASLDLGHQEDVLAAARSLADAGRTVVVVLHDLSLAAAWADEVVLLDAGRVVAAGAPSEVLTAATVSETYRSPVVVIPDPVLGTPLVVPSRVLRPRIAATAQPTPNDPEEDRAP